MVRWRDSQVGVKVCWFACGKWDSQATVDQKKLWLDLQRQLDYEDGTE